MSVASLRLACRLSRVFAMFRRVANNMARTAFDPKFRDRLRMKGSVVVRRRG